MYGSNGSPWWGVPQRIRFAVVERARTYAFDLRVEEVTPDTTTFTMTASSPAVRMAIPPMRLVFDTASRSIVRYEGRVPPMIEGRRGLVPLDARVEYELVARAYR